MAALKDKTINNTKSSEALECLKELKKGLINKETGEICFNQVWFKTQIETLQQYILETQEDENLKVGICEMFGLNNLSPYNDTKAILKGLEEYVNRKKQLWGNCMRVSKELKKYKKAWKAIKEVTNKWD